MSILGQEVHAELAQLLEALQSPDNATRTQAEDVLQNNWFDPRPSVLLMGLAEQMAVSSAIGVSGGVALGVAWRGTLRLLPKISLPSPSLLTTNIMTGTVLCRRPLPAHIV